MIKKRRKIKKPKPHTRVVAGKIKGKLIECPPGEIRPMTSKVKEALFNILGDCTGLKMLDLFSGSGNVSIEAFSHGLESADLIEVDHGKKAIIKKNLDNAGFENARLIIANAFLFCERSSDQYDIIMVDPPFKMENKEELLLIISKQDLLKKNGVLIIHLPKKEKLNESIGQLQNYDTRSYGLNKVMFFKTVE